MANDVDAIQNADVTDAAATTLDDQNESIENENFQDLPQEEEKKDEEGDREFGPRENERQIRRSPRINKGKAADRYGWW